MRYYDNTISTIERTYANHNGTNKHFIYIVKTTKKWLYGNAWNGRWKCDRETGIWYQYENYRWHERGGEYVVHS